jgi:hypothetical protein
MSPEERALQVVEMYSPYITRCSKREAVVDAIATAIHEAVCTAIARQSGAFYDAAAEEREACAAICNRTAELREDDATVSPPGVWRDRMRAHAAEVRLLAKRIRARGTAPERQPLTLPTEAARALAVEMSAVISERDAAQAKARQLSTRIRHQRGELKMLHRTLSSSGDVLGTMLRREMQEHGDARRLAESALREGLAACDELRGERDGWRDSCDELMDTLGATNEHVDKARAERSDAIAEASKLRERLRLADNVCERAGHLMSRWRERVDAETALDKTLDAWRKGG